MLSLNITSLLLNSLVDNLLVYQVFQEVQGFPKVHVVPKTKVL